jgi:DNA (cytosine-5)-methyltransferase 1
MLTYLAIAERFAPRWLVWENVPGVLSSNGGKDFGTFLGGLGELGYGFAYRVLDAQYFGVAQRRRRVFVVANLGDWRRAAAVLFERESLLGHPAPRRETRKDAAAGVIGGIDYEGNGHDCGEPTGPLLKGSPTGGGHKLPAVARALTTSNQRIDAETETLIVADTLTSHWHKSNGASAGNNPGVVNPIIQESAVRRLTPRECERLQGFPDDYTNVLHRGKPAADGPRYKALGNSMAVPVMQWIGRRIDLVESTLTQQKAA